MTLTPLWNDGVIISIHAIVAIGAMVLGAFQFILPKGTSTHRGIGTLWVSLMAIVAVSSFWIHEFKVFGPFSAIHLLSIVVLFYLFSGIRAARRGEITKHKHQMTQLYLLALLITGALTLLPGRTMHAVIFSSN